VVVVVVGAHHGRRQHDAAPRRELRCLRAVPHRAGSELTRRQTTRPLRRLAPAVDPRHA
jgi:hypothetical protein